MLGRGIDFAHRLEAYADASHIVVNDMFYRALRKEDGKCVAIDGTNGAPFPLHGIPCDKVIKGWPGEQRLWLLTNPGLIEAAVEYLSPSPYESNALSELFCYYVNGKRTELSGQSADALVYRGKVMKGGENDGVQ